MFVLREDPWSQDYGDIQTEIYPGEANGLKMGFKIAILNYLDFAIMDQTGVNIDVGRYTQLAVTARIVKTS